MLRLIFALLILTLLPSPAHADVTGKPRIVDGDTIHIGNTKIRLHGIDAPEMKQTCRTSKGKEQLCGVLAKQALERLVKGQDVICKGNKRDRYKRLIGRPVLGMIKCAEGMQCPWRWNGGMISLNWGLSGKVIG